MFVVIIKIEFVVLHCERKNGKGRRMVKEEINGQRKKSEKS